MKQYLKLTLGLLMFVFVMGGFAYGAHEWGQGQANVNTATKDELVWFLGRSGVDNPDQIAENIITYRNANGPFEDVADLKNVKGINDAELDTVRPWVKVTGQTEYEPEKTVPPHRDPFPEDGAEQHWR